LAPPPVEGDEDFAAQGAGIDEIIDVDGAPQPGSRKPGGGEAYVPSRKLGIADVLPDNAGPTPRGERLMLEVRKKMRPARGSS